MVFSLSQLVVLLGAKIIHHEILEIICITFIYLDGSMDESEEGDKETPKNISPLCYAPHPTFQHVLWFGLEP